MQQRSTLGVVLVLVLTGCGGGPAPETGTGPSTAATSTPTQSAPPTQSSRPATTPGPRTASEVPRGVEPADCAPGPQDAPSGPGGDGQEATRPLGPSLARAFVDAARTQRGAAYVFGAEAGLDDPDPDAFDNSELTQWAAHQVGVTLPDGSMYQYLELKSQGRLVSVAEGLRTEGALLFSFSSEPTPGGGRPAQAHVAISLGDGRTIEARGTSYGVNEFPAAGRFDYAGVIPELDTRDPARASRRAPVTRDGSRGLPALRLSIKEIYDVARAAGFTPAQARTWTAIALAESGGETGALATEGGRKVGLWQIDVSPGVRANTWGDLRDPAVNARAAYEISCSGTDLRPWPSTRAAHAGTARDYRTYLDDVERAVAGPAGDPPRGRLPTPTPSGSVDSDGDGLSDAYERLLGTDPLVE